jgi:CHAT domain-containing protein
MSAERFDLLLTDPAAVRVIASPGGDTSTALQMNLQVEELRARYQRLLDHPNLSEEQLRELGEELFDALMSGQVARLFYKSLGAIQDENGGLHIRLRIESPALAGLPWELLFSQEEGGFLVATADFTLSRYHPVPLPVEALQTALPLRILVLVSAPADLPPLNVEAEIEALNQGLKTMLSTGGVELLIEEDARRERLLTRLQGETIHALHFVGHGGWEAEEGHGVVFLEKTTNGLTQPMGDLVDAAAFAELLSASTSLRLVTLNACNTAYEEAQAGFAGIASQLVQRGTPAVIAMRNAIEDQVAITFAKHLYGNLASGSPINIALTRTRQQLRLDQGANPAAFSTPVLYMHAPKGNLFKLVYSRQRRLVQVTQQIVRLGETSEALAEWKELHDILQVASQPLDSVYQMSANPVGATFIPGVWNQFQQAIQSRLIPFAGERMRFIGRPYQQDGETVSGEEWAVRTLRLAESVVEALRDNNLPVLRERVGQLRALIFKHMAICNRQMLEVLQQVIRLYGETKTVLEALHADDGGLNWAAIESDLLDLGQRGERIAEWVRLHDLFDRLHFQLATVVASATLAGSVEQLALPWSLLRDTLILELLEQAKQISLIGKAYTELPDGSLIGEAWAMDVKRKSDGLNAAISEKNLESARQKIVELGRVIAQHYLQVNRNIRDELFDFTKCNAALHARVAA